MMGYGFHSDTATLLLPQPRPAVRCFSDALCRSRRTLKISFREIFNPLRMRPRLIARIV